MKIWSIFHNKIRSVCNLVSLYCIHPSTQSSIYLSIHPFISLLIHLSIHPSIQITFIHFRLSLGESCVLGSLSIRPSCMWLSVFSSYSAEQKRDDKSKGKNSWHFLLLITLKKPAYSLVCLAHLPVPSSDSVLNWTLSLGLCIFMSSVNIYIYIYIYIK